MGSNDFWISNNGKKEHLNSAKHGVRKDQVDKKFHNLFDAYDINGDGTLENDELGGIFKGLTKFAGADKTLDAAENKKVASLFANQAGIKDADFMGFVRSVSKATEDIIESKTTSTPDGGREVTTTYKDGSVETISYYPDGEYKFKKLDKKGTLKGYNITINNQEKFYTPEQMETHIKAHYDQYMSAFQTDAGTQNISDKKKLTYDEFKKNILNSPNTQKMYDGEMHALRFSERAQEDIQVRDFILNYYIETHREVQEALESMGIFDDAGALINDGAGEIWNAIKNKWNGTEEEFQSFYKLSKLFEPSYNRALVMNVDLERMRLQPEIYFRDFETDMMDLGGTPYNYDKSVKFQQTIDSYQNAQILQQKIDVLDKAMLQIRLYQSEQDAITKSPAQSEGLNPASHIMDANKLLLQYFDGDQDAVDMVLDGTVGNTEETIKVISGLKENVGKLYDTILDGKTFEELENDYKSQYKEMYGTLFVPDELTEKVMEAKATGGMVKLAAITVASILITKTPIMAEISAAAAGSTEATGAAANLVRTLVAKYGQTAVQQGIKLAMTNVTLATDVGLTVINQATSERGVNGGELWESTKGSAKYIFFGAYVGAPLAQGVSKALGKIGATSRLFEGGVKTGEGAIQTTSITGDKLLQNFMKGGNTVLAKGGAFLTEVGAFAGLDVASGDMDIAEAIGEQGTFLPKLKLMNHVLEYMLGARAHTATSRADLDAAIKKSGVDKWNIKEIKTPKRTEYIVDIDGLPVGRFEDANQLATAMLERVTANYTTTELPVAVRKPNEPKPTPQGMNAEEDALIQKARKENPADVVEGKIFKQWVLDGLEEPVKPPLANAERSTETSYLILTGEIRENLVQRYDEMGNVFTEIAKKHSADIEQLAKANPTNKQAVADGIVKILAQELGMEGFEPPIVFADTSVKLEDGTTAKTDGGADWPNGRIVINEDITNVKKLTSIISHEFVHMLQYRDVLAQYGEQGLRDLIANDKSIPEDKKESYIKDALENDYNKHLLQSYNFQKVQEGTVENYLRRIYKDEFTNTVGTEDMPRYVDQASERGAYSSQEKVDRGLDESNLGELSIGEIGLSNAELVQQRLAKMREKISGKKSGQDISSDDPLNAAAKSAETVEIDEFGQVHRKPVPAGISTMSDAEFATKEQGKEKLITPEEATKYYPDEEMCKFLTRTDGKVDMNVINAAIELKNFGIKNIDLKRILCTCTGLPAQDYCYKVGNTFNSKIYNKFKSLLEQAPKDEKNAAIFKMYVTQLAAMAHTGYGEKAVFDDEIFELGKLFILTSDYTRMMPNIEKQGGKINLNKLCDLERTWYNKVRDYMKNSLEGKSVHPFYLDAELLSEYMQKVNDNSATHNDTNYTNETETTNFVEKESVNPIITIEQAQLLCSDDALIKLVTTKDGKVQKDALDVAMQYKKLTDGRNDEIEFLLEQCNGNYKKVSELMDKIQSELDKLDLEIQHGSIVIKGLNIGEYPNMDNQQFMKKYGSSLGRGNKLLNGCYRIDDLMNFYLFGKGNYIESFYSGNIMKDFDIAYGCRSVTDGYHVRYTNIHNKENEIAALMSHSLSNLPTPDQRCALGRFKGDMSESIQERRLVKEGNDIEEYLSNNPLNQSISVKREDSYAILSNLKFADGVTLKDAITNPQYHDRLSQIKSLEGQSFINDRFMSTTVGSGAFGNCDVNWDLEVSEGVGATYLDILGLASEGELLLNRGLKITIIEINDITPNGVVHIKAKVEKAD